MARGGGSLPDWAFLKLQFVSLRHCCFIPDSSSMSTSTKDAPSSFVVKRGTMDACCRCRTEVCSGARKKLQAKCWIGDGKKNSWREREKKREESWMERKAGEGGVEQCAPMKAPPGFTL